MFIKTVKAGIREHLIQNFKTSYYSRIFNSFFWRRSFSLLLFWSRLFWFFRQKQVEFMKTNKFKNFSNLRIEESRITFISIRTHPHKKRVELFDYFCFDVKPFSNSLFCKLRKLVFWRIRISCFISIDLFNQLWNLCISVIIYSNKWFINCTNKRNQISNNKRLCNSL